MFSFSKKYEKSIGWLAGLDMGMAVLQEREVPCREMGVAIQKWYGRGYKKTVF